MVALLGRHKALALPRIIEKTLRFLASNPIDFEDALIVAHMERQAIRELYSYDRDFDQVPGVDRLEP